MAGHKRALKSALTYQVGAHFEALTKGVLVVPSKMIDQVFFSFEVSLPDRELSPKIRSYSLPKYNCAGNKMSKKPQSDEDRKRQISVKKVVPAENVSTIMLRFNQHLHYTYGYDR